MDFFEAYQDAKNKLIYAKKMYITQKLFIQDDMIL